MAPVPVREVLGQVMRQTSAKWFQVGVAGLWLAAAGSVWAERAPYGVRFLNVPERSLRSALEEVSEAAELRDQPPPTDALLLARGERDRARLLDLMKARGYYEARLDIRLAGPEHRRRLVFDFTPGPRYRLGEVRLAAPGVKLPTPAQLGLRPGQPARADFVLEAERELLQAVRRRGYPFPRLATRSYRVDTDRDLLEVELAVDPGPRATFGPTEVTGLVRVAESYVRGSLAWQEGDVFDPELVEDTRSVLARSGLFSTLALSMPDDLEADGSLPTQLQVRERRRRTVSATVGYKTDEGAGAGAQWEHRNLFGNAERLRLNGVWAEQAQSGEITLDKPQFRRPDQQLELSLRLADEQPEAYDSRNVRAGAELGRQWNRRWSGRAGAAVRYTRIDQLDEKDDFLLFSLPGGVTWNTSDDPLDARRGHVVRADAEPFYDALAGDVVFLKSSLRGQRYLALNRARTWVLAGRAAVGGIAGAGRSTLPADELFYAGGGASIRGYAYQSVGPLVDDQPVGGRSLLESSLELRWQMTRNLGLVSFVDGGTAFAAAAPDFDETLRWGAGAGLRYYTPIGPLRVDVGFPLDRRPELDKSHQLYVSLGQAF